MAWLDIRRGRGRGSKVRWWMLALCDKPRLPTPCRSSRFNIISFIIAGDVFGLCLCSLVLTEEFSWEIHPGSHALFTWLCRHINARRVDFPLKLSAWLCTAEPAELSQCHGLNKGARSPTPEPVICQSFNHTSPWWSVESSKFVVCCQSFLVPGEEGQVGNYLSGVVRETGWINSNLMCIENRVHDGNTRWCHDYMFYFT